MKEELSTFYHICSGNQEWRQGYLFIGEQDTLVTVSCVLGERSTGKVSISRSHCYDESFLKTLSKLNDDEYNKLTT